jgi:hypothetical protein
MLWLLKFTGRNTEMVKEKPIYHTAIRISNAGLDA